MKKLQISDYYLVHQETRPFGDGWVPLERESDDPLLNLDEFFHERGIGFNVAAWGSKDIYIFPSKCCALSAIIKLGELTCGTYEYEVR